MKISDLDTTIQTNIAHSGSNFVEVSEMRQTLLDMLEFMEQNSDAITPEEFGAVGDGTTEDYTALQDAINHIETNGGTLRGMPGKTYKCSTGLTANFDNFKIRDITIDASGLDETTDEAALTITGSQGSSTGVTSGLVKWGTSISVSDETIFTKGDIAFLESTEYFYGVDGVGGFNDVNKRELIRVEGTSTNTVSLSFKNQLKDTYAISGNTITLTKLNMIDSPNIECVKIIGGGVLRDTTNGRGQRGIVLSHTNNARVIGCELYGFEGVGIEVDFAINPFVFGCYLEGNELTNGNNNGNQGGYGVLMGMTSGGLVSNVRGRYLRRAVDTKSGQIASELLISDCISNDCFSGIAPHMGRNVHVDGCKNFNCDVGGSVRSKDVKITNNYYQCRGNGIVIGAAISDHDNTISAGHCILHNNVIEAEDGINIICYVPVDHLSIKNNDLITQGGGGSKKGMIELRQKTLENVFIENNTLKSFDNTKRDGIQIGAGLTPTASDNIKIAHNNFIDLDSAVDFTGTISAGETLIKGNYYNNVTSEKTVDTNWTATITEET